ncbi:hypothetical protein GCM10010387_01250 [Streptomyces inusitatus]|uniref:DUF3291 domain-containing protein n=1 Tax=Streptomyces inusitatus TaxID=68221 RepID=A0A918PKR8_9ACTN|nr:DUF3291 domain-containing protein [Streptomyces inusitatus]GGZ13038.1 hypothetical protein GCM10010387_01250 [Streptomyces inusitatus]
MPTLPWTPLNPTTPGTRAYAMAGCFQAATPSQVPRFLLKSLAAWNQIKHAPGAIGASLIAQPLERTFYTLSAWEDRDALYTYVRTEPHRSIMTELRPSTRRAVFTFWETPVEELPISWDEARRRLREQESADRAGQILRQY